MRARTDGGTGRPDAKMSHSEDPAKRARFGTGPNARKQVQAKANKKRRQRDRTSTAL